MSRILSMGFELQSATANIEGGDVGLSGVAISTTVARNQGASMRCNSVAAQTGFDTSYTSTAVAFGRAYIYMPALPPSTVAVIEHYKGGGVATVGVCVDSTGHFILFAFDTAGTGTTVGTSAGTFNAKQWYRVETKVDMSANPWVVDLQVDGASVASGTVALAANTTSVYSIDSAGFTIATATPSNVTFDIYFDDIAVNNNSGSFQTSFPGAGSIVHLLPSDTGDASTFTTQTGGTTGTNANYSRVNEITPNDATSFNGTATLNQEDLFNCQNIGVLGGSSVTLVCVGGRIRNDVADATTAIKYEIEKKSSGTISQSAAIIPNSTTWRTNSITAPWTYPLILYQDPDGANWDYTTINSMQIGYKLTAANVNRIDVTKVWALVEITGPVLVTPSKLQNRGLRPHPFSPGLAR